jgi:putative transcriptional regulator
VDISSVDGRPVARLRQGVFLFAVPELRDPNFHQTVVLLINYEPGGAMGVIINKPTEIPLDEALPDIQGTEGHPLSLYFGGPVTPNRMLVLLRSDKPVRGALKVFKDVYYTGSKYLLEETLKEQDSHRKLRVYAGYAGWAPGQLDNEVNRGDWVISPADPDMIFSNDPDKIWPEIHKIQEQIEIHNPSRTRKKIPERT